MQDKQKDKFSEEENDYSRETKAPQTVMTAFGNLDRNRKIVVIFLVFFSFSFFIFWIVSTKNTISNQLNPALSDEGTELEYELFGAGNTSTVDFEDIDRDLSETSNEACPPGQDCRLYNVYDEPGQANTDLFIGENINFGTADTSSIDEDSFINILEGGVNAQELREMLLSAGMNGDILDSISDEDLLQSYQEILQ